MVDLPSPFGTDETGFDASDEFVPAHLPDPGPFLADHDVLTGEAHVRFHEQTHEVFEARSVYDVTFDYNLARLNLDTRHPDAGFRYAESRDDSDVLRAEFTPTTEFCPQSETLAVAAFRAWNGLTDEHEYETVRVRVHPMHQHAETVNGRLADLDPADPTGDATTPADVAEQTSPTSPF
jgi:hypothetical protein